MLRPLLCLLLCLFGGAGSASAGSGEIQDGKLNLLVYFAYAESDPASWIPVFDAYSELMLNSTEGALQLGNVRFTRCPELQNQADIWILDDFSGARAHLSGLGKSGLHMTFSQLHKSTKGSSRGQFGMLHESGHYLWGCYDEYLGYIGNLRQRSALHFCSLDLSNVGCIMDGGTNVFPNNQRTEFCTDTNLNLVDTRHNQGVAGIHPNTGFTATVVTDQQFFLGRSCWSQMALSGVGGLSNQTSAPDQSAPMHTPVQYDLSRLNGDLALSLVIDVSGSMSAEGRLTQAILGGQNGVGLLRPEESLSIVSFNDTPTVVFGQQSMGGAAKNAANSVLSNLQPGGGTVAGSAVLSALGQLARVNGCVEFIVLITDGVSAAPNLSDPSVSAALAAGGQAVYAVAIGSFPDVAALNAIAAASGGAFYSVSNSSEIPGVLADIFSTAGSGTPVTVVASGQVPAGSGFTRPFSVAARDELLRVSLSFAPAAGLELSLRAPDGSLISALAPPPGTSVFQGPGSLSLELASPASGAWSVLLDDPLASASLFDLQVFVEGAELDVNSFAAAAELTYPDPMQLSLSLVAGVPVGGALVSGMVRRPDGSRVACELFDNGLAVHGDARAGDGVYSTLFANYVGDGAYTFELLIDADAAVAVSNEECGIYGQAGGEDGQTRFVVEGFQACAQHTLLLKGQTSIPSDGGAGQLAEHPSFQAPSSLDLSIDPATPVAAFRWSTAAGQPLILGALVLELPVVGERPELTQGMALHLDSDGDGRLDMPSVPLAFGALNAAQDALEFTQPGGALAWLEAAQSASFLLTLGEGPTPLAASEQGSTLLGGSLGSRLGNLLSSGRWALLLPGLGCLWMARRRRSSRVGPQRRLQPLWLLGALLFFALPACDGGGGGGSTTPGSNTGDYLLRLEPSGLQLRGAVSGQPSSSQGAALDFRLDLLAP